MRQGDVIADRFELGEFVARGGMGDVWRARDRVGGGEVALKLLTVHYPQLVKRLAMEARALTELDHPAIVKYVAHETDEQRGLYLAMEWLDGVTLSERLRAQPLSVDESLVLGTRVAEGLGAAHARGMVHRDVKPLNIILPAGRVEQAKILDFGIVRLTEFQQITATGVGMGTPEYMSPEQARCDREIGPPADVFALGCVLYRCLTGQPAFRGRRIEAVLAKIAMVDQMPRVGELQPSVPAPVDELVATMMSYEPGDRPVDGAAAARLLRQVRDRVAIGTEPTAQVRVRRALTRHELEPVSVIFADLDLGDADTVPSEVIDLESLRFEPPSRGEAATLENSLAGQQVLRGPSDASRALPAVRRALEPYGARVELLLNGSMVAMISGGVAAKDLSVRAARCALAIRSILPDAAVGVASGRALASDRGDLGPIIDGAAALVKPRSREIWIDAATAALLPPRFEVGAAKGAADRKELVEERLDFDRPGEAPRKLLGRDTTCVGRNRLLRQLAAAFAGCVEDRATEAMVVLGDAGVGKSRFRAELVGRIEAETEGLTVVAAWGDPYRSKAPYGLLGRTLRSHMAVPERHEAAQRNQLRAAVRSRLPEEEVERVTEFVGELTGVRFPDETSARLRAARRDPELMADQIRRSFEDWLAAEASHAPVLLVMDDLQWADDASVALVTSALRRCVDLPLMVLALGRPEVHDRFPSLGDDWNRQEIVLDALRPADCEQLVEEALGDSVDAATRATLIERSAGNPFYLEELIRAAAAGQTDRLPESVVASVQLRIGRLPEGARQVLRAASVYGRRFWPAGIGELLDTDIAPEEITDWLGLLEREELVLKVSAASGLAGEAEYVFRHDLTREAAYSSLTDEDRETGHRLAGSWLEEAGERDAIVLAEHFAGGGAAGQAVEWFEKAAEQALAERDESDALESLRTAARYLLRAAETAAGSYANETAVAFYERGIALLSTIDPLDAVRARLSLSDVRERVGQRERALRELAESLEWIGARAPALQAEILLRRAMLEMRSQDEGALRKARRAAHAARDLASREQRKDLEAKAMTAIAVVYTRQDSEDSRAKAVRWAERALATMRALGEVGEAAWRLGNAFLISNDLDRATSLYAEALETARRSRDEALVASCAANMGMVEFRRWRIPEAIANTERALSIYRRVGHSTRVAEMMVNLGTFHQFGGDPTQARALLEEGMRNGAGDWVIGTMCREILADIEQASGNESLAQHYLSGAAELAGQVGADEKRAFYLGLLAESFWNTGHIAEGLACLEQARDCGGFTLSHALLAGRMGQVDTACQLLERFQEVEPDADRRVVAKLALARIRLAVHEFDAARALCAECLSLVPARSERFSAPVWIIGACADRDQNSALASLAIAMRACVPQQYVDLCADVGELLLDHVEVDLHVLERFVELTLEPCSRRLGYYVAYLRARALRSLGRVDEASEMFDIARSAAEALTAAVPEAYRDTFSEQPRVRAASRYPTM